MTNGFINKDGTIYAKCHSCGKETQAIMEDIGECIDARDKVYIGYRPTLPIGYEQIKIDTSRVGIYNIGCLCKDCKK